MPLPVEILRCPSAGPASPTVGGRSTAGAAGGATPSSDGIPRLLDDSLPGIAEKRAEIAGWPELARSEGWYEPDDEVDRHLPFLCRDLGWDDRNWRANEHSFSLLLER